MGAIERLGLWRVIHGELDMNLSRLDQSWVWISCHMGSTSNSAWRGLFWKRRR
jgi:hypothetical protein